MGCCFSKELTTSKNNEKTGLLQKSVEEEAPETRISKTLPSILQTVESKELHATEKTADLNTDHEQVIKRKYNRPFNFFLSFSRILKAVNRYESLDKSKEKKGDVSDRVIESTNKYTPCMNNTEIFQCSNHNRKKTNVSGDQCCSSDCFSPSWEPVPLDQGSQKETSLNRSYLEHYPFKCEHSLTQNEAMESVKDKSRNSHRAVSDTSHRQTAVPAFAYIDIDHRQHKRDQEFYSICIVDAEDLKMDEEVPATMHGATAADIDNSAVTTAHSFSVACFLDSEREFPILQSTQVEAEFNTQKELPVGEEEHRSNLQKKETKENCSMDGQSFYHDLLDSSCQTYKLNMDCIATDGLSAVVYDEEFPENRIQGMDTLDSSVSLNESINRNCESVKLVNVLGEEYCPYSKSIKYIDSSTSESLLVLNAKEYNSEKTEARYDRETIPLHLSEHLLNIEKEANTKQNVDDTTGNLHFHLECHKMYSNSFSESHVLENLSEEDSVLKPESGLNSNEKTNKFKITYCQFKKETTASCEPDNKLEQLLEDEKKYTDETLCSFENALFANVTKVPSKMESILDLQTDMKGSTETQRMSNVLSPNTMEDGSYVSIIGQTSSCRADNIPVETGCQSRTSLWVRNHTLASCKPHNTSPYEIIHEENSLKFQLSPELLETKEKIRDYSSSFNKNSVSSVSLLAYSNMNKIDLNYKQDEQQDKCSFHVMENQLSAGTDPARLVGSVVGMVKQPKLEMHQGGTVNGTENSEPDSEVTIFDCDSKTLSDNLMQNQNIFSVIHDRPLTLEECTYDTLKMENGFSTHERANNLFGAPNCLSPSSPRSYSDVLQKQARDCDMIDNCADTELKYVKGSPEPAAEELSGTYEKNVSDLQEPEFQRGDENLYYNNQSREENIDISSTSSDNAEALTSETIKQLETKNAISKNGSYILDAEMKKIKTLPTTNPEQTETCDLSSADKNICEVSIEPGQVDKYAATPSYELLNVLVGTRELQQGNERCVLDLMEDILNESESTCKPDTHSLQDQMGSQSLTLQTESADLTSRISNDIIFSGNGAYLMGYLWNNTASNTVMMYDNQHICNENLQNQSQDLTVASFAVEGDPYQLLVANSGGIWGWQDEDELVSNFINMAFDSLLCCRLPR
uniref:Uncharacterized protein n=1 Tax=Pelusios castaneus TaxID=367368 RepID=A0A8C8SEY3_9SAUR